MTAHRSISLTCDGVLSTTLDIACLAEWGSAIDYATARAAAHRDGWRHDSTGRDLCPDCARKHR